MKSVRRILLTALLIVLLLVVTLYSLLQSRWGAEWISRQINARSSYHLTLDRIEHHLSTPGHLFLDNVTLGRRDRPHFLSAERIDLGLSLQQLITPLHFSSIRLLKGTLDLNNGEESPPVSADRLLLNQMALHHTELSLQAQRIDGAIMSWQPAVPSQKTRFQISIGSLMLNDIPVANALLEGSMVNGNWTIDNLSADVARGTIAARGSRDAQGGWHVPVLRLSDIRLQSDKTLNAFLQPLLSSPNIQFGRVDVTDARLEGRDWAITDLDMTLKNIMLSSGSWQSEEGILEMKARSFINGSLQLDEPVLKLGFGAHGINLTQFSSRWVNGLVSARGNWDRATKRLHLDEAVIAGLEYTLPANWRSLWSGPLPEWLDSVEVTKLSANRNLIIDINTSFPFQMTSLEGTGNDLLLASNHQWGMWRGSLSLSAAEATFNRVDLRHPSLTLKADSDNINMMDISAVSGNGMLKGSATLSQQPNRTANFELLGRQVALDKLQNWGWSSRDLRGEGSFQLTGEGSLRADRPLKETVDATISATSAETSIHQRMIKGEISANTR